MATFLFSYNAESFFYFMGTEAHKVQVTPKINCKLHIILILILIYVKILISLMGSYFLFAAVSLKVGLKSPR